MWNGKKKAITFSFDDGCQQDVRLVELLNKYQLKATFNLNSGLAGSDLSFPMFGSMITRHIVKLEEIKNRYQGHEVAAHSLYHPNLTLKSDKEVLEEIEEDQKILSSLVGYNVIGMAYPGGDYSEHLVELLKQKTSIKYARTVEKQKGFGLPQDPFTWAQYYWLDNSVDFETLIDDFLSSKSNEPQLLAIWGHSYEADAVPNLWEKWERLFAKMSRHPEVFFGTNKEVLCL